MPAKIAGPTPVPVFIQGPRSVVEKYFTKNGRLYYIIGYTVMDGQVLYQVENCQTGFYLWADEKFFDGKEVIWINARSGSN